MEEKQKNFENFENFNEREFNEQVNNFCKTPITPNPQGWYVYEGTNTITLLSGLALQGLLANPNNKEEDYKKLVQKAYNSAIELVKIIITNNK